MRLMLNEHIFAWRMTGLLGSKAKWFFGFSKQPLESDKEEPRLVSYALDGSTCTLNIDGVEYYYTLEATSNAQVTGDSPAFVAKRPVD